MKFLRTPSRGAGLLVLFALALPATSASAQSLPEPGARPCQSSEHRQFDFWVGHWDVFGPFEPLMESRDGATKRRVQESFVLRGPHRTHGTTDEWLDDEALMYSGAGLFRWGSQPGTRDAVVLRVWESDDW